MPILSNMGASLFTAGVVQADRLLVVTTPLGRDVLLAETLDAVESVGEGGYAIELGVLATDAHLDLATLIGQPLRLEVQTALGRDAPRIWHGHVTAANFECANGGLARYRLRVEPWLAFLRGRRDSFAFQDLTVFDIVESVLRDYQGKGKLAPAWRWEVKDRSIYPRRSLTTQYRETDFAFVDRLLAEEGLFYWFEHASADDEAFGKHTMVIADSNDAFTQNPQAEVRFHRADATETEDTLQGWSKQRRWQTHALRWSSWDYRSMQTRPVRADGSAGRITQAMTLADDDYPGQYAYEDSAQGERLVRNALAAQQVTQETYGGVGTVRTLAAGTRFDLVQHWSGAQPQTGSNRYIVLHVRHIARNNFDEDMSRAVLESLGNAWQDAGEGDQADFYTNRLTAINVAIEYRPATRNAHGQRLHPKPTVTGAQTALVVSDDKPVQTDRDHRVKVQFHWQRGEDASNRLAHPSDDQNAPASGRSGTWVRVAEPVAGNDWGGNFVPRAGQEVLVQFMHGDIDRPVVVGALYNGAGTDDAQYNRTQSGSAQATGNAPAWFAGTQGAHAHNATLSGIKTQALTSSGQGTGGYNQLVFDDTPGEGRISVASTQADSRLNLGHIKRQRDNERQADLGHGAELASRGTVAVRAGLGLLISAAGQEGGKGAALDSSDATAVIKQAQQQAQTLASSAKTQDAALEGEPEPGELPAIVQAGHLMEVLQHTLGGEAAAPSTSSAPAAPASGAALTQAIEGGQGSIAAFSEPHVQFTAPSGIAQYTPEDLFTVAGGGVSQFAQDVDWLSGRNLAVGVASGLVIYTAGKAGTGAVQERGLRLHAASGKVSIESQDAAMRVAARKAVGISSTNANVEVQAPIKVLMTAGGAYLKLEGGGIQLHAPGKVELRGSSHSWGGPQTADGSISFDEGAPLCEARTQGATQGGGAVVPLK